MTDRIHTESTIITGPVGSGSDHAAIQTRFQNGDYPVAVYGLGKMGLPLAAVFSEISGNVTGADIDSAVVETLNAGDCHIKREPGLAELTAENVAEDRFNATTDIAQAARDASIHVVIVPTPITDEKEPDLSTLDAVVEDIGPGVDVGDLVVIECTVPPRTCFDRVMPRIARLSGLDPDEFGLAFCPERTSSGRALDDIRGAYPKVVGGVTDESTRVASAIYETINSKGVIQVSDATTAECVKLFEGLYRDVNIALANELATFTDSFGIDVREAIAVANTQPFCDIHEPGPGVGGHCIPFYPYFVINEFAQDAPLLETARRVNDSMPAYTVGKLREEFAAERTGIGEVSVVILGLTYRPGVEEIRATPALPIAEELSSLGATVYGVDPVLDSVAEFPLNRITINEMYSMDIDAVVLVTPHEEFMEIEWDQVSRAGGQLIIIDGRDALSVTDTDHRIYTIGRSS